jgi:outer membrane lipoprotein
MNRWINVCVTAFLAATITACETTGALPALPEETVVQPYQVSADGSDAGRRVAWGGTVIRVENLADRTRLEMLAFPLDSNGIPDTGGRPAGRFLADYRGFLDPVDYAPGRRATLRGVITGSHSGKVGDAPYQYPVIEAEDVRLWTSGRSGGGWWPPQLHIGIGVYGGF